MTINRRALAHFPRLTYLRSSTHTAVIINLDYENQQRTQCKALWGMIETGMQHSRFSKDGRVFVIDQKVGIASELAQDMLNKIEADYVATGQALRPLIREFYCVPDIQIIDLLSPSMPSIEVCQMDAGAFERFFGVSESRAIAH